MQSSKIVKISVNLKLDLLPDLGDEVQTDDALVLGHVQAVVRADRGQKLERHQRADLTQDVGGGTDL